MATQLLSTEQKLDNFFNAFKSSNFESIILKFFEPGHTFMAADSVHAAIEKKMKKIQKINDK